MILMEKKLLEDFMKKTEKQIKKFRMEKVIQKKGDKLYFKWKSYNIVCLIVVLIKKDIV